MDATASLPPPPASPPNNPASLLRIQYLNNIHSLCKQAVIATTIPQRTHLYTQLFACFRSGVGDGTDNGNGNEKDAAGCIPRQSDKRTSSTLSESEQHSETAAYQEIESVLPSFYRRLLSDLDLSIRDSSSSSSANTNTASDSLTPSATPSASASTPSPGNASGTIKKNKELMALSKQAALCLTCFLFDVHFSPSFPASFADSLKLLSKEAALQQLIANQINWTLYPNEPDYSDGILLLLQVLRHSSDIQLVNVLCWCFNAQQLPPATLSCYIDYAIDVFVIVSDRWNREMSHPTATPSLSSNCVKMNAEMLNVVHSFALKSPRVIRDRVRSSRPDALNWLITLVIQRFLTPEAFQVTLPATPSKKTPEAKAELAALSSKFSSNPSDVLKLFRKAMALVDFCLEQGDLLLSSPVTQPQQQFMVECRNLFFTPSSAPVSEPPASWVNHVADLHTQVQTEYENYYADHVRYLESKFSTPRSKQDEQGVVEFKDKHEAIILKLHESTLAVMNIYLKCISSTAVMQLPPTSKSIVKGSTALNSFLGFYQKTLGNAFPSIRLLLFEKAWSKLCKVITCASNHGTTVSAHGVRLPNAAQLGLFVKPFLYHLKKDKVVATYAATLKTLIEVVHDNFITTSSTAAATSNGTRCNSNALTSRFPYHRIQENTIYDACIKPVLDSLASTLLPFDKDGKFNSNVRARLFQAIKEGFTQTQSSNGNPAAPMSASISLNTDNRTIDTHSTSGFYSTNSTSLDSLDSAIDLVAPAPPRVALSLLPAIFTALLVQPISSPTRASFLASIEAMLVKNMTRISTINEIGGFVGLYDKLLSYGCQLPSLDLSPAALVSLNVMHSSSSTRPSSAAAGGTTATIPSISLVQALFFAWGTSAHKKFRQAIDVVPASNPAISAASSIPASFSSTTSAMRDADKHLSQQMLNEAQSDRLYNAVMLQLNVLKSWLNHSAELERMKRELVLNEDGSLLYVGQQSTGGEGYNLTPTPSSASNLAAPVSSTSAAVTTSNPVNSFYLFILSYWMKLMTPSLTVQAASIQSQQLLQQVQSVFLEGVSTILTHHFESSMSLSTLAAEYSAATAGSSNRMTTQPGLNLLHSIRYVGEFTVRTLSNHPSQQDSCWLTWQLLTEMEYSLLKRLLPRPVGTTLPQQIPVRCSSNVSTSLSSFSESGEAAHAITTKSGEFVAPSAQAANSNTTPPVERFGQQVSGQMFTLWDSIKEQQQLNRQKQLSPIELNEHVMEVYVDTVLLAVQMQGALAGMDVDSSPSYGTPSSSPSASKSKSSIDWNATLQLHSHHIFDYVFRLPPSSASNSNLPDLKQVVVQCMNECQSWIAKQKTASSSQSPLALHVKFVTMFLSNLYPESQVGESGHLHSPLHNGATPQWKQWKSHSDAPSQKLISALLEESARFARESPSATKSKPFLPYFKDFFHTLSMMFARLSPAYTIDGIAWFFRLCPGFYALLQSVDVNKQNAASNTSAVNLLQKDAVVAEMIELWSYALTAFRKNFHASLDFGLLGANLGATRNSFLSPPSTPTPTLLFVDMLTLGFTHSLNLIRSPTVHYWIHTFAGKKHSSSTPLQSLKFDGLPQFEPFVKACKQLLATGELKQNQVPILGDDIPASPPPSQRPIVAATPLTPSTPSTTLLPVVSPSPRVADRVVPTADSDDELNLEMNDGSLIEGSAAPISATKQTQESTAHTPTTSRSFLPSKQKSNKLLDRLSNMSEYAFKDNIQESPAAAKTAAMTSVNAPAMASTASFVESVASQNEEHDPKQTLSPFPTTPAAALTASVPHSHLTPQRVISTSQPVAPRTLESAFNAVVADCDQMIDADDAVVQAVIEAAPTISEPQASPEKEVPEDSVVAEEPNALKVADAALSMGFDQSLVELQKSDSKTQGEKSQPQETVGAISALEGTNVSLDPVKVGQKGINNSANDLSLNIQPSISQPAIHLNMVDTPSSQRDSATAPGKISTPSQSSGADESPASNRVEQDRSKVVAEISPEIAPVAVIRYLSVSQSQSQGSAEANAAIAQAEADPIVEVVVPLLPAPLRSPSATPVQVQEMLALSNGGQDMTEKAHTTIEPSLVEKIGMDVPAVALIEAPVESAAPAATATELAPPSRMASVASVEHAAFVAPPIQVVSSSTADVTVAAGITTPPVPVAVSSPPTSRKRPAPGPGASPNKRVMFRESMNVSISPSPHFSASSSMQSSSFHDNNESKEDVQPHFTFSPVPPDEDEGQTSARIEATAASAAAGSSASAVEAAAVRAEKKQQRAEMKAAHENKKAQLKALANPNPLPSNQMVSILKSAATASKSTNGNEEKSSEESESEMPSKHVFPNLVSSLVPLTQLHSHLPSVTRAQFNELFTSLHLVTVGDVAATAPQTFQQAQIPLQLRLYVAQESHRGSKMLSVVGLIQSALQSFLDKANAKKAETTPTRKRKLIPPTTDSQDDTTMLDLVEHKDNENDDAAENGDSPNKRSKTGGSDALSAAAAAIVQQLSGSESRIGSSPVTPFVVPEFSSPPVVTNELNKAQSHVPMKSPVSKSPVKPRIVGSKHTSSAAAVSPPAIAAAVVTPPVIAITTPATSAPGVGAASASESIPSTATIPPVATASPIIPVSFVSLPSSTPSHGSSATVVPPVTVDMEMQDAAPVVMEDEFSEPMQQQMEQVRFHLRSSIATMFAPASVSSATPSPSYSPFNVLQQLNLNQLQEIQSCVATMEIAIQQQVAKLKKGEKRSITPSNTTRTSSASKSSTPTRTNSSK